MVSPSVQEKAKGKNKLSDGPEKQELQNNQQVLSRPRFDPWDGKMPCRKAWQPILVFLPGEFHGQRSLAGPQSMGSHRVRHNDATNTHLVGIMMRWLQNTSWNGVVVPNPEGWAQGAQGKIYKGLEQPSINSWNLACRTPFDRTHIEEEKVLRVESKLSGNVILEHKNPHESERDDKARLPCIWSLHKQKRKICEGRKTNLSHTFF